MIPDVEEILYMKSRHRKARKMHQCAECKLPITPGTIYCFNSYAYAGEGFSTPYHESAKICLQCEKDWETLLQAEFREDISLGYKRYGELKRRILSACDEGWLRRPHEKQMYRRWNGKRSPGAVMRQLVLV